MTVGWRTLIGNNFGLLCLYAYIVKHWSPVFMWYFQTGLAFLPLIVPYCHWGHLSFWLQKKLPKSCIIQNYFPGLSAWAVVLQEGWRVRRASRSLPGGSQLEASWPVEWPKFAGKAFHQNLQVNFSPEKLMHLLSIFLSEFTATFSPALHAQVLLRCRHRPQVREEQNLKFCKTFKNNIGFLFQSNIFS